MTRLLAQSGRTVHDLEVEVEATAEGEPSAGRLLSVAELQHALQLARVATAPTVAAPLSTLLRRPAFEVQSRPEVTSRRLAPAPACTAGPLALARPAPPDLHPVTGLRAREPAVTGRPADGPNAATCWVAVVGAHGGAGASTVAVALADAAGAGGGGRSVHLISHAAPHNCGLVAVTSAELGVSDDGSWRRGRRGTHITVDRAAQCDQAVLNWPAFTCPRSGETPPTILDADPAGDWPPGSLLSAAAVLLVFRVTVPGVRHVERVLAELRQSGGTGLRDRSVLLAAVGPRRWPGVVSAAAGPLLRQQQRDGQLVPVPLDRRLERTGLTSAPLPKSVAGAGALLLRLLEPALRPGVQSDGAQPASLLTPPGALRSAAAGWQPGEPGDLSAKESCA